jgi:lipid-binding SYLF domain-containing protein
MLADSVGGMFEDTARGSRGKRVVSSRRVPLPNVTAKNVTLNVTNAAMLAAVRCFDGESDGEDGSGGGGGDYGTEGGDGGGVRAGGGGGGSMSTRNTHNPVLDTPPTPIRGDRVIYPSSPRRSVGGVGGAFGDDGGGIFVEQSLWPVVIVFRRTVQRRRLLSPNSRGWGSPGLSLKGSLFGIPSFRMDDECDRAASLIRQLAPSGGRRAGGDGDGVPLDVFCSSDNNNIEGGGDAGSHSPTVAPVQGEDIEASTIRGMIEAAVGLGFVRLSKVVVGVSLQGGSGILISRLPDGTWSAPSAIGVLGLGVGLQFGLEVCDFVFIIQTPEGMDHFKEGGNFVVGGNIGAAVANCGREAYGAASFGVCTGAMPLDDQIEPLVDRAENGDRDGSNQSGGASESKDHALRNGGKRQKKKDNDIAPMVAYAKSQGLYVGVSVDGLKFFTRNDINSRTYKFSTICEMPARDILDGLVLPPPEVRRLYLLLIAIHGTNIHDMTWIVGR